MTLQRFGIELRAEVAGDRLVGYANVFDSVAQVRGGLERMAPESFDSRLDVDDVRALVNHDPNQVLARTGNGTLKLERDAHGLHFEIPKLPDTSYARDLRELVGGGLVDAMSFGFIPGHYRDGRHASGVTLRTHTEVRRLLDVSPVTYPAYAGTEVSLRSIDQFDPGRSATHYRQWLARTRAVALLHKETHDR